MRKLWLFAGVYLLLFMAFCWRFARLGAPQQTVPAVRGETRPTRAAPVSPPPVPMTEDFAVPVLMYHRICVLSEHETHSPLLRDLTVSPEDFERQVRYLSEHGFVFLRASQVEEALVQHGPLPEKAVVLTMDDGYKDNFTRAFPVLRKYHASATLFLVTHTVDTPGHVAWDDVTVMHHQGVGYGSHTVHHYDLTDLPETQMDYELRESKRVLEGRLAEPITDIAYPSGAYNALVVARTRCAGYRAGWKKGGGPVQPGAERYLLPRVRVRGKTTMDEFKRMVWSGRYILAERRERGQRRQGSPNPQEHRV